MKFATLALLGSVAATEETELVGKRWRWDAVGPLMRQEGRIMETLEEMKPDIEEAFEKIGQKLEKKSRRYIPELIAWSQSDAVKAKEAHDKKIGKSKYGRNLKKAVMHVAEDAQKVHWASGFNQDGYAEWIKNEDLAMMFEDVYEVKEAFKALIESEMAAKNGKLGAKTLENPHF